MGKKWFSFNEKTQRTEQIQASADAFNNTELLFWSRGMEEWVRGPQALDLFLNPPVIKIEPILDSKETESIDSSPAAEIIVADSNSPNTEIKAEVQTITEKKPVITVSSSKKSKTKKIKKQNKKKALKVKKKKAPQKRNLPKKKTKKSRR